MKEKWIKIKGYEHYAVSNYGRVKSIKRNLILKTHLCNGYPKLSLSKNDKKTRRYVHRLVAESFIDNPNQKECVNHKDGNKENNFIENLEWATYEENHKHAVDNKLINLRKRVWQIDKNTGNIINGFESLTDANEKTGVYTSSISRACRGGLETAGGYEWKYSG